MRLGLRLWARGWWPVAVAGREREGRGELLAGG